MDTGEPLGRSRQVQAANVYLGAGGLVELSTVVPVSSSAAADRYRFLLR